MGLFKKQTIEYIFGGVRVHKDTPGAKKVVKFSKKWYGGIKINGQWKHVPLFTDKQSSLSRLGELVKEIERGVSGLTDSVTKARNIDIAVHVQDFMEYMSLGRFSENHIKNKRRLLNEVIAKCGIKTLADVNSGVITKFLSDLKKKTTKNSKGPVEASARTKETYRGAIFSFCRWCSTQNPKRLSDNPVESTPIPKGPVVHKRRAESVETLNKLLKAAEERQLAQATKINRGKLKGLFGAKLKPETIEKLRKEGLERKLVYNLAVQTGMRYGEIKRLKVGDIIRNEENPFIIIRGFHNTKNKKDFNIPIKPSLLKELNRHIEEMILKNEEKLFNLPEKIDGVFKKDLQYAGVESYCPETNTYFDFHSLRHCTDTFLMAGKNAITLIMLFMRHSKPELSMVTYNDTRFTELSKALASIPDLG